MSKRTLSKSTIAKHLLKVSWLAQLQPYTFDQYVRYVHIVCEQNGIRSFRMFTQLMDKDPDKVAEVMVNTMTGSARLKALERMRKLAAEYTPSQTKYWWDIIKEHRKDNKSEIATIRGKNPETVDRVKDITIDQVKHQLEVDLEYLTNTIAKSKRLFNEWGIKLEEPIDWRKVLRQLARSSPKSPLAGIQAPLTKDRPRKQLHMLIRAVQIALLHRLQIEDPYWVCRKRDLEMIRWKWAGRRFFNREAQYNYLDLAKRIFVINTYKTADVYGKHIIKLSRDSYILASFLRRFKEITPFFRRQVARTKMTWKERARTIHESQVGKILTLFRHNELGLTPTDVRKVWITEQVHTHDPKILNDGVHANSIRTKLNHYVME